MKIALLFVTTGIVACTNLYPENSTEREQQREFTEMHLKHIR
jgi:hypothetical protein